MITQDIVFTAAILNKIRLIECRTCVCGQLKKICCGINKQVRACDVHELFGVSPTDS